MISSPATAESPLDPVLDFLRLLWSIEHGLQSMSKRMESSIGITGPQRLVLRIVSRSPGMSAGTLARIVRLHPSTVTGILQRLVAKGLLTRVADPADSRRIQLRVADRARAFTKRTPATVEAAVQQVLLRAPAAHVAHARAILTAIADAFERRNAPAAAPRRRGPRSALRGRRTSGQLNRES